MKKVLLPAIALALISVTGCLKSDTENTPRAAIMVNLFSPNAANTNIYLNGTAIGTNISYGSTASGYNQISAGVATVQITNSAGTTNLLNASATLAAGKFYSAFIIDTSSKMKMVTVVDSVSYPASTDSIKVRFYNFAVGSAPITVGLKDSAAIWTSTGLETQTTANDKNVFKPLKAGSYAFHIAGGGTSKDTTITFTGGHVYTLYTKGYYNDTAKATRYGLAYISH